MNHPFSRIFFFPEGERNNHDPLTQNDRGEGTRNDRGGEESAASCQDRLKVLFSSALKILSLAEGWKARARFFLAEVCG